MTKVKIDPIEGALGIAIMIAKIQKAEVIYFQGKLYCLFCYEYEDEKVLAPLGARSDRHQFCDNCKQFCVVDPLLSGL